MEDPERNVALSDLVLERKNTLELDEGWSGYSDVQREAAFLNLETIQRALLRSNFRKSEAKLLGLALLLDGIDHPNFADQFKNDLFEILRQSE